MPTEIWLPFVVYFLNWVEAVALHQQIDAMIVCTGALLLSPTWGLQVCLFFVQGVVFLIRHVWPRGLGG